MNTTNLARVTAALAVGGLLSACAAPPAGAPANSPTANATPAPNTSTAQASPAKDGDPPSSTDKGKSAPPNTADANSGAAAAKPAAPATPGAASGTISGQVTASPAKYGKHIVVWLDGGGLPAKPKTIEINQRSMKFLPYLSAIPAGGKVVFRNSDPFPHNVFTPDGDKFNLGMMPANSARVHVFKKPGSYTLLCQIHPGMIAYVYVVPSKYYAVADHSGHYSIKNVPNGSYKLSAWAPKLAVSTQTVNVAGAAATVSLHLHRGG